MKDHRIVAEMLHLEALKARRQNANVIGLFQDAKYQNEDWIMRIDGHQSMIALSSTKTIYSENSSVIGSTLIRAAVFNGLSFFQKLDQIQIDAGYRPVGFLVEWFLHIVRAFALVSIHQNNGQKELL